ncbi:hypothetical protein [Micromonospora sp. RP3T]|uniref:hypothetical protein n=1 Tax=Micromonospora sp. RP3T TaxID=2135446 RepID=UPI003D73DC90
MSARNDRGLSFDERVARAELTPQQRENARATLLLAEQVHDMCGLLAEQNDRLAEHGDRLAEQNALLAEIRDRLTGPATVVNNVTAGRAVDKEEGGDPVRLREPAVPPGEPGDDGRPVADPAAGKPTTRRPTTTAAARAASTKTTPPARRARSTREG